MLRMLCRPSLVVGLMLASAAPASAEDIGWPRSFEADGDTVVVYQPQVEAWKNYGKLRFLMAVSVLKAGENDRSYGVIEVSADTKVNHAERSVLTLLRKNVSSHGARGRCPPASGASAG